ncbi:MAG TPA: hypothetical protein VME66_06965 [Candidatus Acidoferrales bacterium]|nr:hypothetical protein [Candidatus Acidoferrales bacterium]
MSLVVVGIAADTQTVHKLEEQLETAGLPLESIDVITPDDFEETPILVRADDAPLLGDPGTSVPGLSSASPVETSADEGLSERLADFDIPDSEADSYAEALRRGRSIVAYFAKPETLTKAQEIFREASVANVRVY